MNEAWGKIFKDYVDSYEAIQTLKRNHVIDDDFYTEIRGTLLDEIIETFKTEVED